MQNNSRDTLHKIHNHFSVESNSGCWIWLGGVDRKGYGTLLQNKKRVFAHRLALAEAQPPMQHDMLACHKCDVPRCINPDHLFWGTHKENSQDALAKGRTGNSFQSEKLLCKNGHRFDESNTKYVANREGSEKRACRECRRLSSARYHSKIRGN